MSKTAPRRWFNVRPSLLALTAVVATLLFLALGFVGFGPHTANTETVLVYTSTFVEHYWNEHHRLPPNLAALPPLNDRPVNTTDRWSRPLQYTIVSDDTFTLSSLGRDGQPGGQGDDADLSKTYQMLDGRRQELRRP